VRARGWGSRWGGRGVYGGRVTRAWGAGSPPRANHPHPPRFGVVRIVLGLGLGVDCVVWCGYTNRRGARWIGLSVR
jgi:hypothetical protein